MIESIIKTLSLDDFYGQSETVDIAKGKYKYPSNFKGLRKLIKRRWQSKR